MVSAPISVKRFGPLEPGAPIHEGWNVGREFSLGGGGIRVRLERKDGVAVTFVIGPAGIDSNPGRFDADGAHIAYDQGDVPFAQFEAAGNALVEKLKGSAKGSLGESIKKWLAEAKSTAPAR
jgi:hypothetical protein